MSTQHGETQLICLLKKIRKRYILFHTHPTWVYYISGRKYFEIPLPKPVSNSFVTPILKFISTDHLL